VSIRLLVVDDQEVVREGLARILASERDFEVVGSAGDGRTAVTETARLSPGVVLMDIRMPVLDGLAATREIVARDPDIRVVVLTTFDLDEYVYEALRAGASGFVLKDAPADEILRAVRAAAAGDALISPAVTRRLIAEFARHRSVADGSRLTGLTGREREVLVAMARGLSNEEIGRALFIAEGTVRTHVTHLLAKLGARDRVQAVVAAYESGIVRPGHTEDPA
jgi:DNA-binding NarL/FixJ family response regulator